MASAKGHRGWGQVDGFGIPEQLRYAEMLHPEHSPDEG
jgi:hypothetical protein